MKRLFWLVLILAAILSPRQAHAGRETWEQMDDGIVSASSITWCGVAVSSTVVRRVDNYNSTSGCDGLMTDRSDVKLCNPTGGVTIHFGYSAQVSTQAASARVGEELIGGACKSVSAKPAVAVYVLSDAGTPPRIEVVQAKIKP